MAFTAGTIVNAVRDMVPDPQYDGSGNPLPDQDGGLFRASSLYRWLDAGVRIMTRALGSVIIDWTAIALTTRQPWYAVNSQFEKIEDGFVNQWPIDSIMLSEGDTIWPSTGPAPGQPLWGFLHKVSDHLEMAFWPVPNNTDPVTTLTAPLAASGVDPIPVASTLNFLSFGYVQIDQEIIAYQQLTTGPAGIGTISRGVCGTTAAAHLNAASVQHLGIWLKGERSPATLSSSTSVIELPLDVVSHLEDYLLARCRFAEQEDAEGARLMKQFHDYCKEIRADPSRKESMGQITPWGSPKTGPIYFPSFAGGRIVR
jgi:hypothetical protein